MSTRILTHQDVRDLVDMTLAMQAVEEAFGELDAAGWEKLERAWIDYVKNHITKD